MKAISFELSGKFAFFKKPDVNTHAYFTYNNIHKPALLGLLGAILGLSGHNELFVKNQGVKQNSMEYDDGFPEFYEKLKDFKICIIPLSKHGYFNKKIQTFNNSVGYASKEAGGNLIVREQWLENPKWKILILQNQSELYTKLKEYIFEKRAVFVPYLGKNDHFAKICDVREVELYEAKIDDEATVNSLFIKKNAVLSDDWDDLKYDNPFEFNEFAPVELEPKLHIYKLEKLCFTNYFVSKFPSDCYSLNGENIAFI